MPNVSSFERRRVAGASGRDLGRISAVLFHPSEPRVVGFEVARSAVLGMVDRSARFVLLGGLAEKGDVLRLDSDALPKARDGERTLGFSWEDTVIWHGMTARSVSGEPIGYVHDVEFSRDSGAVATMKISTGMLGDAAVGRLEVPAEYVRGFDGEAVVVLPGYNQIEATGGAAKVAAAGATAVKDRTGQVADGMLQVGVAAAGALGRSLKSGIGRKTIDAVKSLTSEDE